ncbi:hypothetical protein [Streptomyces thioluteus]
MTSPEPRRVPGFAAGDSSSFMGSSATTIGAVVQLSAADYRLLPT